MSAEDPIRQLNAMIETFLRGDDQTVAFVDKIAQHLIEQFPEDPEMKDLLLAVSAYAPHGGGYLYDETALSRVMREALVVLRQRRDQ